MAGVKRVGRLVASSCERPRSATGMNTNIGLVQVDLVIRIYTAN